MDFFGSGLKDLLISIGLFGAWLILFAESGLLFGFFLPGDSLLFTAGFLASQNVLSLPVLIIGFFIAAVLGDNVGYTFGKHVGKRLFTRKDSLFFHQKNIQKAQGFYDKYGSKTWYICLRTSS